MISKINERIKDIMREKNISQKTLSEHLGLSQPALYQRLNSRKTFQPEELVYLADWFEIPISDLIYEFGDTTPQSNVDIVNDLHYLFQKYQTELQKCMQEIEILKSSQTEATLSLKTYTVSQVAELMGVDHQSVRTWLRNNDLAYIQVKKQGKMLIKETDLIEFMERFWIK